MPKQDDEMQKAMALESHKATGEPLPIDPATIALAKAMAQELVAGIIAANNETRQDASEMAATAYAGAMKTIMRPENEHAPLVSDFNPRGERDHPRPPFKCQFFDCNGNAEIIHDLSTVEEVTLLNMLEPGHYLVEKANGVAAPVSVVGEYDSASGALTKMKIYRRTKGDDKNDWPAFDKMLAQMIGVSVPVVPERAAARPKFGRVTGPMSMGAPGGVPGTIQSLDQFLKSPNVAGSITRDIGRMQSTEADAIAPVGG